VQQFKRAALDDTIYVLTPQDKVIDLPPAPLRWISPIGCIPISATAVAGAKVDGHMTPLNTPLQNGQRVEIVSIKERRSVA
jgi:GTP pyrophosphokinase